MGFGGMAYQQSGLGGVSRMFKYGARIVNQDVDTAKLLKEHGDKTCNHCSSIPWLGKELPYTSFIPTCLIRRTQILFLAEAKVDQHHVARSLKFGMT